MNANIQMNMDNNKKHLDPVEGVHRVGVNKAESLSDCVVGWGCLLVSPLCPQMETLSHS